ncbi:transcriptional regulator [Pseudomonas phage PspYZU05]|uniref:Double-stranded DNA binding protein n=1 Tax=Pseudomonas phage PspYZU05 TaxID=1983556 RepID=A0A2U7N2P5_9CAUD|nr:transcriptional regulator [Pseudomonas phage PspYZU05]ASD52115.1 double-stranded DNA binding protein [Pseudomonas phage PspYZU05]
MAKREKVEFNADVHGEELARIIKDCSDNKLKAEGYMTLVSEAKSRAKEELGVSTKQFNMLLSMYHSDTRERFENEKDELVEIYDTVFGK